MEVVLYTEMLHFKITDSDITMGAKSNTLKCPAAIALGRTYPDYVWHVSGTIIYQLTPFYEIIRAYEPSIDLMRFIWFFDKNQPLAEPGDYSIIPKNNININEYIPSDFYNSPLPNETFTVTVTYAEPKIGIPSVYGEGNNEI